MVAVRHQPDRRIAIGEPVKIGNAVAAANELEDTERRRRGDDNEQQRHKSALGGVAGQRQTRERCGGHDE